MKSYRPVFSTGTAILLAIIAVVGCAGKGGGGRYSRSGDGYLGPGDIVNGQGGYLDIISFRVSSRKTLTFRMTSGTLDSFIGVTRGGSVYGTDDDSGPGLDAMLTLTLNEGDYEFRCTDFRTGAYSGSYSWSIDEDSGNAPNPESTEASKGPVSNPRTKLFEVVRVN